MLYFGAKVIYKGGETSPPVMPVIKGFCGQFIHGLKAVDFLTFCWHAYY